MSKRARAKKYGITIWDEKKLSELFDEAIEKREKIRSKILLEAGLKGTKEIDEEINYIREKYDCSRTEATMLLRGELKEEELNARAHFVCLPFSI